MANLDTCFIIRNAIIVNERRTFHAWLEVRDGYIENLGEGEPGRFNVKVIDAGGKLLLPWSDRLPCSFPGTGSDP
jgi:dihydroorotase-like cyclic amidohydrolase